VTLGSIYAQVLQRRSGDGTSRLDALISDSLWAETAILSLPYTADDSVTESPKRPIAGPSDEAL